MVFIGFGTQWAGTEAVSGSERTRRGASSDRRAQRAVMSSVLRSAQRIKTAHRLEWATRIVYALAVVSGLIQILALSNR